MECAQLPGKQRGALAQACGPWLKGWDILLKKDKAPGTQGLWFSISEGQSWCRGAAFWGADRGTGEHRGRSGFTQRDSNTTADSNNGKRAWWSRKASASLKCWFFKFMEGSVNHTHWSVHHTRENSSFPTVLRGSGCLARLSLCKELGKRSSFLQLSWFLSICYVSLIKLCINVPFVLRKYRGILIQLQIYILQTGN